MYNTILVPLDGSKRSEVILPHVEQLAKNYRSKVIFVSVQELIFTTGVEGAFIERDGQNHDELEATARAYLEGITKQFQMMDIQSESHFLKGRAVESILKAAEDHDADLVVLASHGKGGISRVFYGSVASGIVNNIDRPLLIVRSRHI